MEQNFFFKLKKKTLIYSFNKKLACVVHKLLEIKNDKNKDTERFSFNILF